MKHRFKTCLLLVAAVGLTSSLSGEIVKIQSPNASTGYVGLAADGTSLTDDPAGTWKFSVGMTGPGFDAGDFSTWEANFSILGTANWVVSPAFLAGKFEGQYTVPAGSPFTGNQAYIWGYNQQSDLATAEWVFVTNAAWVFPANNPLSTGATPANTFDISNPTNTFIAGFDLDSPDGFQMQAIPEPSTYALIFGLGILGFLGFRRFRK